MDQELDVRKGQSWREWGSCEWHGMCPAQKIRSKQNAAVGGMSVLSLSKQSGMEQRARGHSAYGQEKPGLVQSPGHSPRCSVLRLVGDLVLTAFCGSVSADLVMFYRHSCPSGMDLHHPARNSPHLSLLLALLYPHLLLLDFFSFILLKYIL